MPKFDTITIGGATKDYFLWSDECFIIDNPSDITRQKLLAFEYGAKVYTNKLVTSLGGGACNVAVGLSRLGFKTTSIACLGSQDEIQLKWMLNNLKKEKVNINLIQTTRKASSGTSFIVIKKNAGEHTIFSYRGANEYLKLKNKDFLAKWIYLSSFSNQFAQESVSQLKQASKKGIKIMFNPGSRQIAKRSKITNKIFLFTEILTINRDEAIEITNLTNNYNQAPHIKELLDKISKLGPKIVAITDGANGAYAKMGGKTYFQRAKRIKKPIDTTGAGDAFGAGFLAGIMKYNDIEKALALGIKNGSSVIQKIGAEEGLIKK